MDKNKNRKKVVKTVSPISSGPDTSYDEFRKIILPLLLAVLCIKLIFLYSVQDNPFVTHLSIDEQEHDRAAREILKKGLLQNDAFYFLPLYPYLLAAYYALFGFNTFGFKIIQSLSGALNVIVVYYLARTLFQNRRIALIASGLTFFYGVYYFYEALLMTTALSVFFVNLAFLLLLLTVRSSSRLKWFSAGFIFGVSTLLRGNVILLLPFIFAWLVYEQLKKRVAVHAIALWGLGIFLGIVPAAAHNAIVSHDFVLIAYQGGTNFYIGNHEGATGIYIPLRPDREIPKYEKYDAVSLSEEAMGKRLTPSEVSSYWFRQGLSFIAHQPFEWLRLMWRKFSLFNNALEIPDTIDFDFFKKGAPLLHFAFVPFWFIFACGGAGFYLSLKNWREYIPLYLTCNSL
jgi:4-amino-4-deoxy-L-arabinose transferase-like glycosyltransferase